MLCRKEEQNKVYLIQTTVKTSSSNSCIYNIRITFSHIKNTELQCIIKVWSRQWAVNNIEKNSIFNIDIAVNWPYDFHEKGVIGS